VTFDSLVEYSSRLDQRHWKHGCRRLLLFIIIIIIKKSKYYSDTITEYNAEKRCRGTLQSISKCDADAPSTVPV